MATTRRSTLLKVLSSGLLLATAAAGAGAETGKRTIQDQMGRAVAVPWPVKRVVCLAPSDTEIMYAIGAGDRLVGRDTYSDYPPAAHDVPTVGNDYEPSLERVLGLRPDVVVTATTANRVETVEALERFGLPVVTTKTDSLAELRDTIRLMGELLDRADAATSLVAEIDAGVARVKQAAAELPPVPALIVVWSEPLYVVGRENYTAEMLGIAGGENVGEDAGPAFPKYSLERVIRNAPEVIVVGSHKDPEAGNDPAEYWSRWPTIPAVKGGRIHVLDGDVLFRPSPRFVQGIEDLFEVLHPKPPETKP